MAGARRGSAIWGVLLLLSGCALPIPEDDGASTSYPGAGSGYTGV